MQLGLSVRRACHLASLSTSSLYHQKAPDKNQHLLRRMKEVARPGQGYRLVRAAALPEFGTLNPKRVYRLSKLAKLARPTKRKKKRTGNTVPLAAKKPNQVWCLDFCHDACLNGTKLKILAVKDEFTRECLALEAATSLTSKSVQRILARLFEQRGAPTYLRSDNGPEFICRALCIWLLSQGSHSYFIKPGSPWQNGHAESFIARLRAECLNAELFTNLADSRLKLGIYQRYYNHERPHSALNYLPPAAFAAQVAHQLEPDSNLSRVSTKGG